MTKINNGTTTAIRTGVIIFGVVATIVTTVFWGGSSIGKTEQAIIETRRENTAILERQELQEKVIDTIRTEQAYQKGVVNTKLDNLQVSIEQIMEIISKWEPE